METIPEHEACGDALTSQPAGPRRLSRTIAVASWLYLLIVLAVWAAIHFGDLWWPATLLLFSPRWFLAIPLLPLGLAAARWRRRSLIGVLLALFLVVGPIMGFHVPWRAAVSPAPTGEHLRVFTCNIHYRTPRREALERLLAQYEPDIVAVQELPSREPFDYCPREGWYINRTRRFVLASRYPIRKAKQLGNQSMTVPGSMMRYELDTPVGAVTLFSLHLASPRYAVYQTLHHPKTGIVELEDNSSMRQQQWENLVRLADEVPGPVLLVGDFNTPSESAIVRREWDRYTDAFAEAGWSWGYTFLGAKTAVRIDHILAGPGWSCKRCWVGADIGSPHRPVLADLFFSKP